MDRPKQYTESPASEIEWVEYAAHLELENARLTALIESCESLTGDMWPQNETTRKLAEILGIDKPTTSTGRTHGGRDYSK